VPKCVQVDLAQYGSDKARQAQFSRLGTRLAVVPASGRGKLFRLKGMHGDVPQLEAMTLPDTAPWQALAFRPEPQDSGGTLPDLGLLVACGDEIVELTCKPKADWVVRRRLPMPAACAVAFSHDGCMLVAGSRDGHLRVWAYGENFPPVEIDNAKVASSAVSSIAVSHDHDLVYFATARGDCFEYCGGDSKPKALKAADERSYGLPYDWECATLACHPREPLVVLAGSGALAWSVKVASEDPYLPFHTAAGSYIRKVCFLSRDKLALLGENAVELWNPLYRRRYASLPLTAGKRALAARQFVDTCYVVVS
jgi:hypothetical protein